MTFTEIESSGKKSLTGKYTLSAENYEKLTSLAKHTYSALSDMKRLQDENIKLKSKIWALQHEISQLRHSLSELTEKCKPYLEALKAAPKTMKEVIDNILERFKKQENNIEYEPISVPHKHTSKHIKRSKDKELER